MAMSSPVMPGTRVAADANLHRRAGGRLLFGGAPMRVVRLTDPGAEMVAKWLHGEPVGEHEGERRLARRLLEGGLVHPMPEPVERPDVTVVIPVLDDEAGVRRTVETLGDVPIVVVDDGSRSRVRIDRPGVTVLRHDATQGPAAARMTGLAAVDSALVLFLDADVEIDGADVAALAGHFADPDVAAVAPRVASAPGPGLRDRYEEDFSPLDLGPHPSPVGPGRVVSYLPSAALLARTEIVRAAGGFDPSLRFGEDVDLIWRLAADDQVIRYDPSVVVRHAPRPSWGAWVRQRVGYGSSAAPLAARHGAVTAPARPPAPVAAGLGVALVAPAPVIPLAAAATAVDVHRRVVAAWGSEAPVVITRGALEHATSSTVTALLRAWWPLTFLLAAVSRRARLRLVAALVAVVGGEYARSARRVGPVRGVALRLVDHFAYGVGVWRGVIAERSATALRPVIGNRRRAAPTTSVAEP